MFYGLLVGLENIRLLFVTVEGGVKGDLIYREIEILDIGATLGRAVKAVHASIFPLDREWANVATVIEGDDDFLEIDIATTDTAEIPVAAAIAEIGVPPEHADVAIPMVPPSVLHVYMKDAGGEVADELHVINPLIAEMGGVVVKAKPRVPVDGIERPFGARDVEGNLGGMHFQGKVDVLGLKGIEDRGEALGKIVVTSL